MQLKLHCQQEKWEKSAGFARRNLKKRNQLGKVTLNYGSKPSPARVTGSRNSSDAILRYDPFRFILLALNILPRADDAFFFSRAPPAVAS